MEIDFLPSALRDEIISGHLRDHLPQLGLKEIKPRIWIDDSQPPVRRLFELQLLKGAGIKACWGFSLDFVPHISGGKMRWHRSDKAAMLDVIVDPKKLLQATYIHGRGQLVSDLRRMLPEAAAKAKECWERGRSYQGMLDIIRETHERHTNCFDYRNYTQMPLAFALLSAKTGALETAVQELDHYITTHSLDDDQAFKLRKLGRDYAGI